MAIGCKNAPIVFLFVLATAPLDAFPFRIDILTGRDTKGIEKEVILVSDIHARRRQNVSSILSTKASEYQDEFGRATESLKIYDALHDEAAQKLTTTPLSEYHEMLASMALDMPIRNPEALKPLYYDSELSFLGRLQELDEASKEATLLIWETKGNCSKITDLTDTVGLTFLSDAGYYLSHYPFKNTVFARGASLVDILNILPFTKGQYVGYSLPGKYHFDYVVNGIKQIKDAVLWREIEQLDPASFAFVKSIAQDTKQKLETLIGGLESIKRRSQEKVPSNDPSLYDVMNAGLFGYDQYQYLATLQLPLIDLEMFMEIVQSNTPRIIVYAGGLHTQKLKEWLIQIGFKETKEYGKPLASLNLRNLRAAVEKDALQEYELSDTEIAQALLHPFFPGS